jgi:hypothetical protein
VSSVDKLPETFAEEDKYPIFKHDKLKIAVWRRSLSQSAALIAFSRVTLLVVRFGWKVPQGGWLILKIDI